jgi:hypothetical protein
MRNNKTKSTLESFRLRGSLFWDVDPKTIDVKKHAAYIIERVLEFGKDPEVRWVWQSYQPALLKKVVKNSRVLSPKTRSLWTLLLKNR